MKQLKTWVKATGAAIALLPYQALAQSPFVRGQDDVKAIAGKAGVGAQQELPVIIGNIINVALGFLGTIFLVLMLYAGFLWMTAQGEDAKVKKAREMITQAIIGIIIIAAAFAISNFVLKSLVTISGS